MFSKGGGDGGASAARVAEDQRQGTIRWGTSRVDDAFNNQFNSNFYDGRRKSYLDYANPQLEDQYADARKQLTYWLDRNGMLDSTARTEKEADLQKLYDTNKRSVNDRALDYENKMKSSVEDARGNLIGMLSATGDVEGATSGALSRAAALSAPEAYDPLGQMFTSFTSTLGNQAGLERMDALAGSGVGGQQIGRYNTGLFGHKDSVRVY